jgi:murein DD-endopeptidase MepM/ murein hydrolase activator NlpD
VARIIRIVRKAVLAGLVCALLFAQSIPVMAARPNEEETAPAPGPYCIERVAVPDLVNVIDAKWSPDGRTLALVRFERKPDSGPGGYIEDEVLELLDMKTQHVRSLGSIWYGRPAWSPSGKYLAYWGYRADFLEVMDSATGEVIAKLTPSNPEFRWQGDSLLYLEKSTIRAWNGGPIPETLGRLGDTKVAHFPEDSWQWSGDGSHFTLTRYDAKEPTPERFLGTTATQDAAPIDLPGALYTEWAPTGATLVVRYDRRIEIRDLVANTVSRIPIPRGALYAWAADGRTLLVRTPRPTVAAGDVYEESQVVWPNVSTAFVLPDVFGVRGFSPDGRFFGGTVRTDRHDNVFAVFRCYEIVRGDPAGVPVPFADRFAKIDSGTGHLIRPVSGPIAQFFHPAHSGVDLAGPFGSPIVAADAGIVTKTGWQPDGEGGIRVCVQHSGGLETCYYHASAILASVGQRVARGEAIAIVGQSGLSNGAHLHWEAKLNGKVLDPLQR